MSRDICAIAYQYDLYTIAENDADQVLNINLNKLTYYAHKKQVLYRVRQFTLDCSFYIGYTKPYFFMK